MAEDYYSILGVARDASKEDIKRAYKHLAKENHPDLHKGDKVKEERFKKASEAYKVLNDEKTRANYDRFGTAGESFQGFNGFESQGFGFDFSDIFESFFSSGGGGRRRQDLHAELTINLEESYKGVTKRVQVSRDAHCPDCKGTGAEDGKMQRCADCNGTGHIRVTRRTPLGMFQTMGTCQKCRGEGSIAESVCKACRGSGVVPERKDIEVKVPAGIADGQMLRVRGQGDSSKAGTGDLIVVMHVQQHDTFSRKGDDLFCELPISYTTAVLGGEIDVPTLDGDISLKIPAGTQPGTVFRLRGRGMPSVDSYHVGNQLVHITIDVPKRVDKRERELLEKLGRKEGKPRKSFFEKIRDAL
ncbi:molecular chaperone DnaJ [Candidatus Woesearchaeota archaeon CG1_02_57_44]|nr:MAG: molecular chaperone DnaJ [Candidatus Woesearchaeota archaeon CG1_02_57_44]